jgi:predicted dehydrogenase
MSAKPVRLAVVGTGGAATLVADAAKDVPGITMCATAASTFESAQRFATTGGAVAYDGIDALLAEESIEAVYLATPNGLHHEQTVAALDAGKHVLVEKPMSLHPSEALETVARATSVHKVVGVGFHLRHSDVFKELKLHLDAGQIGEPQLVRAAWGMALGRLSPWKEDPARAGAGSLMGLGVHILDLVLWLIGYPAEVVASASDSRPERVDRTYLALLRVGECLVEVAVSRSHALTGSFSVYGTEGERHAEGALTTTAAGVLKDAQGEQLLTADRNPYVAQLEAFAHAIRASEPFHADAQDGARCVALTTALLADSSSRKQ